MLGEKKKKTVYVSTDYYIRGESFERPPNDKQLLMIYYIAKGNLDEIKKLIEIDKIIPNNRIYFKYFNEGNFSRPQLLTPVGFAMLKGRKKIIKYLFDIGSSLSFWHQDGGFPKELKQMFPGDFENFNKMKKYINSLKKPNFDGGKKLYAAVNKANIHDVKKLLENGVCPNFKLHIGGCTALISAVCKGYVDIVKLLLEYGADPFIKDSINNKDAFFWADFNCVHIIKKNSTLLHEYSAVFAYHCKDNMCKYNEVHVSFFSKVKKHVQIKELLDNYKSSLKKVGVNSFIKTNQKLIP
ncbi:MAG: ankyrin repeat domain-containing protein [Gammaproteobacteria bacterium]|jgi:ankyrin repeat protein